VTVVLMGRVIRSPAQEYELSVVANITDSQKKQRGLRPLNYASPKNSMNFRSTSEV
jgi:hypothetical protein